MQRTLVKRLSLFLCLVIFVVCIPQMAFAATASENRTIFLENEYLKLRIDDGSMGGTISSLIYKPQWLDLTGETVSTGGGLFRDRVPGIVELWKEPKSEVELFENTDEKVTALVRLVPSTMNKDVEIKKYITLRKGSSSIETKWEITNNGNENLSTFYFPWNNVIPERVMNSYMPSENLGLHKITDASPPSIEPSRNWIGAIDETKNVSISFIMDYNELAMQYQWRGIGFNTLEWIYNGFNLATGETWSTTYFTNVVPLKGTNTLAYASPEISVSINQWKNLKAGEKNSLAMEINAVEALGDVEIIIEITGPNDYVYTAPQPLKAKLNITKQAEIKWDWTPPTEGAYLLKASLYKDGIKQELGKSLQNPSSDIEIPLVAGTYDETETIFPAWPQKDDGGGEFEQRKISGGILSNNADMVVWSVPSLEKIFMDDIVDLENSTAQRGLTIELAKREREAVQIVLSPGEGKDILNSSVEFGKFKNEDGETLPEGSLKYNPVGYVFTKNGSRFDPNIRTGYWPDPLLETKNFDAIGGQNTPIWITAYAEPNVESGIYKGNVIIKSGTEEVITIPMSINVWPFSLPVASKLKTALDFRTGGNVDPKQADLYIDNFLEHRMSPRGAMGYVTAQSVRQDPDFIKFDANMEKLLEQGLTSFAIHRDTYLAPDIAKKIFAHLNEKGWDDMAYVYLTDEPTEETYPKWIEMADEWRKLVPDVKIMITTYPTEKLVSTVDIWTVPGMRDDPQEAKNALERGEELWWYHTDPPHPSANFLIDMPAVDARATFWQSWQAFLDKGYTGFLYAWSTWTGADPWTETGPFLSRNGLESQIYPSSDGPVNSIRWEVMRDGIEDYDYSYMLWELLQRVEKEMPGSVNQKEVVYAKNLIEFPAPLTDYVGQANIVEVTEKWRKEVAESIIFVIALLDGDTYAVTFDSIGGSAVNTANAMGGSAITAPETPTKAGYIFDGWYKEAELLTKWNFETDKVTGSMILYAKWIEGEAPVGATISATYDGVSIASGAVVLSGKELVITVAGIDIDSHTCAWSGAGTSGQTSDSITINPLDRMVDATCTVTELETETYKVTFNSIGGSDTAAISVPSGNAIVMPAAPIKSGYTFDGWYKDAELVHAWDFVTDKVTSDITLYAKWTRKTIPTPGPEPSPAPSTGPSPEPSPEPTPVPEIKVGDGQVTTSITVKPVTDGNGRAVATISETLLADSIAKATAEAEKQETKAGITVNIEVSTTTDAKAIGVDLTAEALKKFSEGKADVLTIQTSFGTMTFDKEAVAAISLQVEGTVTITATKVEDMTPEIREKVGDRPIVSFDIVGLDKEVTQFGRNATVTIPYQIKEGEDPNAIVAYYINSKGELKVVTNGKYDPSTKQITFKTPHFSKYAVGYNKVDFADVRDNAWYSNAVTFAAARGITEGTGNGRFGPVDDVTRAQALVMIMRAFGVSSEDNAENNFSDAGNTYYTGYLAAAKKLGITSGVGDNRFAPERQVTRQDLFVLVYNTLNNMDELPTATVGKDLSGFKDAGKVADYANKAVEQFVNADIISGSNGHILPEDSASRTQFVQILYNIMK